MKFDSLSEEIIDSVVRQIEALVNAFSNQGRLGRTLLPRGLKLYESCREEIIDLPPKWKNSDTWKDINQWRRPQETWYHQIRTERETFGFARSIKLNDGGHRVTEVVPSNVAREFQNACRFIDREEPTSSPAGNEQTVFILHIPLYAFYGLCTESAGKISQVYAFYPEQIEGPRKITEDLPDFLRRLPTAFGVRPKSLVTFQVRA